MELPNDPEILEDAYATPLTPPTDEHYARFDAIREELMTLEFKDPPVSKIAEEARQRLWEMRNPLVVDRFKSFRYRGDETMRYEPKESLVTDVTREYPRIMPDDDLQPLLDRLMMMRALLDAGYSDEDHLMMMQSMIDSGYLDDVEDEEIPELVPDLIDVKDRSEWTADAIEELQSRVRNMVIEETNDQQHPVAQLPPIVQTRIVLHDYEPTWINMGKLKELAASTYVRGIGQDKNSV